MSIIVEEELERKFIKLQQYFKEKMGIDLTCENKSFYGMGFKAGYEAAMKEQDKRLVCNHCGAKCKASAEECPSCGSDLH